MYRILMLRYHKAYAVKCDEELDTPSDYYENLFNENIHEFINNGDVIVLIYDIDDFDRYFPEYKLEIIKNNDGNN